MNILSEEEIEQMALQTLQEQGYNIMNGATIERFYNVVVLTQPLQYAITTVNHVIPAICIKGQFVAKVDEGGNRSVK